MIQNRDNQNQQAKSVQMGYNFSKLNNQNYQTLIAKVTLRRGPIWEILNPTQNLIQWGLPLLKINFLCFLFLLYRSRSVWWATQPVSWTWSWSLILGRWCSSLPQISKYEREQLLFTWEQATQKGCLWSNCLVSKQQNYKELSLHYYRTKQPRTQYEGLRLPCSYVVHNVIN